MEPKGSNGWRSGHDPFVRLLRIATAVVCLGVVIFLVVQPDRAIDDISIIFGALGVVLVLAGYENIVHLPFFRRKDDGE